MSTITPDSTHTTDRTRVDFPEDFIEQSFAGVKTLVKQGEAAIEPVRAAGTVFVMLPAYNEAEGLPSLLMKIQAVFAANGRPYHVIVVDDASKDETSEIAIEASSEMPLTLVQHQQNQNLPGALRTGLMKALEMAAPGDVITTMDGDDTHPPGCINSLLQKVSEGYDVVTASRYQPGSRVMGVPAFQGVDDVGSANALPSINAYPRRSRLHLWLPSLQGRDSA